MPVLDNPKHERFAQERAKGVNQSDAYIAAGYKPCDANACRLTGNDKVQARIVELQARAAARTEITVASITDRLLAIAAKGEGQSDAPMLSVARASLMDAAKLNGLIIDKVQADVTQHEVTADPETTMEAWQSLTPNHPVQGSA